jgi:hypothetical protein
MAFTRDGKHALDLRGTRWFFVSSVAEEGPDRRQPEISALGRDTSILFQVRKKRVDQRCIDLFEG